MAFRPRRSALYVPGSNPRALAKGRDLAADVLIFDLEDAVAPDSKERARIAIIDALKAGGYGPREILVRVNGLDTHWGQDDLKALAFSNVDGIVIPKVESAAGVMDAVTFLDGVNDQAGTRLWCMIETPLGVLRATEIAGASDRLQGLVMGTSDLAKELHCLHTPDRLPFITSLGMTILAARAFGLSILDGVHLDLSDDEGFAASCRQAVEMGFDGKTLIHPKTIDFANEVFGPSPNQIAEAEAVVSAFEAARVKGEGLTVLNGKLIEALHVEDAQRVLTLAHRISELNRNSMP